MNVFREALNEMEECRKGMPIKLLIDIECDEHTEVKKSTSNVEIEGPVNALIAMALFTLVDLMANNAKEVCEKNGADKEALSYIWTKTNVDCIRYITDIFGMKAQELGVDVNFKVKEVKTPMLNKILNKLF